MKDIQLPDIREGDLVLLAASGINRTFRGSDSSEPHKPNQPFLFYSDGRVARVDPIGLPHLSSRLERMPYRGRLTRMDDVWDAKAEQLARELAEQGRLTEYVEVFGMKHSGRCWRTLLGGHPEGPPKFVFGYDKSRGIVELRPPGYRGTISFDGRKTFGDPLEGRSYDHLYTDCFTWLADQLERVVTGPDNIRTELKRSGQKAVMARGIVQF